MIEERAELAKDAKDALMALHSARIRCEQIGLSRLFVQVDGDIERMAKAAALKAVKLSDPRASRGAIRIVRREAEAVLALVQVAEAAMRENATWP